MAGAHGRNVRDAMEKPMVAIVSATSVPAESLDMADKIAAVAPGLEADQSR